MAAGGDGGGAGKVPLCKCRVHGLQQGCRGVHWTTLIPLILVLLILWCTPLPNPYYASCDRPCHELDWPMICRYKMSLEMYESMSLACGQCPSNQSHCSAAQCVPGDGSRRGVMTANRMLPGPTLKVCENDIVVVDVVNRAMGQSLAVHWGGQSQREFPYMDGVPQLTQCPINTHTTFQYKFRASGAGTHLWSATGSPEAEAVFGPLIVKQSVARDPHHHLFDEDQHVFTVSVFGKTLLINGHDVHQASPLVRGRRYRVRLLHGGGTAAPLSAAAPSSWPVTVSLGGLPLLVLTTDGHPVQPSATSSVTLWPGERVDVVVTASSWPPSDSSSYRLTVEPLTGTASQPSGEAPAAAFVTLPFKDHPKTDEESSTPKTAEERKVSDTADSTDMQGLEQLPDKLANHDVDVQLYLPFDFHPVAGLRSDLSGPQPPTKPGSDPAPLGPADAPWPRAVPRMCNISLSLPSAPLLTQPRDAEGVVDGVPICRGEGKPATCPPGLHGKGDESCECTHVIRIPLGSSVEVVLAHQGGHGGSSHVFQLHGYSFWVVGRGSGRGVALERGSSESLAAADRQGKLLTRHLHAPVRKDTVAVPNLGAVAFRFIADNPGYWLLREQSFFRWPAGLGVILQVGEEADLPPTPADFPKCGSFVGPEFFLM